MLIHPAIYQFASAKGLGAEVGCYGKHSGSLVIEHALRKAQIQPEPDLVLAMMAEVILVPELAPGAPDEKLRILGWGPKPSPTLIRSLLSQVSARRTSSRRDWARCSPLDFPKHGGTELTKVSAIRALSLRISL